MPNYCDIKGCPNERDGDSPNCILHNSIRYIYTMILFDDDGVISHMEHFDRAPLTLAEFNRRSNINFALYEGTVNGGDTLCIRSHDPSMLSEGC